MWLLEGRRRRRWGGGGSGAGGALGRGGGGWGESGGTSVWRGAGGMVVMGLDKERADVRPWWWLLILRLCEGAFVAAMIRGIEEGESLVLLAAFTCFFPIQYRSIQETQHEQ